MLTILIICLIIVAIVLILSVLTTSKAYQYKHTVDKIGDPVQQTDTENTDYKSEKNFKKDVGL
ncbi:YtzI protein [Metabacillus herbersteinensis]|uniref:YtzI protein n=1 Tax=Metabacillus herbersteinensis TaxID=283816 RepID=A0ABV6GKM1_9BACI